MGIMKFLYPSQAVNPYCTLLRRYALIPEEPIFLFPTWTAYGQYIEFEIKSVSVSKFIEQELFRLSEWKRI